MNKTDLTLIDGVLRIDGRLIELDAEVLQAIAVPEGVVVRVNLLWNAPDRPPPASVFLLDLNGKVLWRIEEFKFGGQPQYYVNIWLDNAGRLMAFCPKGFQFIADWATGKFMETEFIK